MYWVCVLVDYDKLHNEVIDILRLRGEPVGYKLFSEFIDKLPYIKENLALCQVIKQVAIYGKAVAINPENVDACVLGTYVLGFKSLPEDLSERWIKYRYFTREIFEKMIMNTHAFEIGKYRSALFAPLKHFKTLQTDPDGVILIVNSTQAYLILAGYFSATGVKPSSDFNGYIACELVVPPVEGRSPWLTIPCGGARGLAEAQDDEIWISMKPEHLEIIINRLKHTGMKYPPAIYQMLITPPNPEHPQTHVLVRKTRQYRDRV